MKRWWAGWPSASLGGDGEGREVAARLEEGFAARELPRPGPPTDLSRRALPLRWTQCLAAVFRLYDARIT